MTRPEVQEPDADDERRGETASPPAWWSPPSLPGAVGALVLATFSLYPSLLPHGGITQGLICGINAAIGYGFGVLAAAVWRAFADRGPRPARRSSWVVLGIGTAVVFPVAMWLGRQWQVQLRDLMGMPHEPVWRLVLLPPIAVAVGVGLVVLFRWLVRLARRLALLLARRMGPRPATALAGLVVAGGAWLVVTGVLLDGMIAGADRIFSVRDAGTHEGVEPTTSELRSGGPGSLVAWDDLGRQGRQFAAGGPTAAEIGQVREIPDVLEPIRAYAGIASAEEVEDRARVAVDDLERAGGFERTHLLVATTTGTGWLDPGSMAAFEHLTGGDSAIVTLQYSYLPSWLSYFVDQQRAREAGRGLFDAVYERWVALPASERPELYVFGESLGSFGAEAAFSGEFDLRNRTSGALFVGPPAFNVLREEFLRDRDDGSRQIEPVYRDGRTVRFTNDIAGSVPPDDRPWDGSRVLYLQHPSDPVVWWSPSLAYQRPDWLREERGHDVLDEVGWLPVVTFWQVSADLPFALDVPDGHGHRYTRESVAAWATVLQLEDWDEDQAARVVEAIVPDEDS